MRILILGGDGMLGHQLYLHLQKMHTVKVTLHKPQACYQQWPFFTAEHVYDNVDVLHISALLDILLEFRPDAVINAVGIVKQRELAKAIIPNLEINALLPHRLSQICRLIGARLIQISTDCVFSGKKGNYTEDDFPDANDIYGRTKFLGEVHDAHCITLRTSIIGLELSRKTSLIEWFLAQHEQVAGYCKAIYTGFTTLEMAKIIEKILIEHPGLNGLWHVAANPISKYDLLCLLKQKLSHNKVIINADDQFICDRSLNGDRFRQATGYQAQAWDVLLEQLAQQIFLRER